MNGIYGFKIKMEEQFVNHIDLMGKINPQLFSYKLVRWFLDNQRDLPWRRTKNPYYIWISEVMLQQTQVDTVIPYYESFIRQFPKPKDLAFAEEDRVLKQWEGLGYYSRARNLQKGVREVVEQYNGEIPDNRKDILSLKGIGPYTAGAVLSIAFDQPEPAVDGNVMRVLSRILLIDDDIAKAKTRKTFEEILYQMIPEDAASAFNQGLMELGALICRPKNPTCDCCPVAEFCHAYSEGAVSEYPVKSKKAKVQNLSYAVVVINNEQNRYLIHKRAGNGLLANLYEFPMILIQADQSISSLEIKNASLDSLVTVNDLQPAELHITHTFSHLKWNLNVFTAKTDNNTFLPEGDYRWVSEEELIQLPFPVPHQKVKNGLDKKRIKKIEPSTHN